MYILEENAGCFRGGFPVGASVRLAFLAGPPATTHATFHDDEMLVTAHVNPA